MYQKNLIYITAIAAIVSAPFDARVGAAAYEYLVTDLGVTGGPQGAAYAINSTGAVVGFTTTASADCHAVYFDGALIDLGTLGIDDQSMAFSINDAEQVAAQSYRLGELQSHAMLWQGGTATNLGHFAPRDINGAGLIVGHLTTFLNDLWVDHACKWQAGILTDLGTLGGRNSRAFAVDTSGRAVGQSYLMDDQTVRACLWLNGIPHDLGALDGAANSSATDINDSGRIVGWSDTASGAPHAFSVQVDSTGIVITRTDLGTLENTFSVAYGLNSAGDVVGTSNSRAVLWRGNQVIDLNTRIPSGAGWVLGRAHAINTAGQIVGEGAHVGFPHGYLLTPVTCTKGDVNDDGARNGLDIQAFVQVLLVGGTPRQVCAGDVGANPDGELTTDDVEAFAQCLLETGGCQ
ncbi:MAG TPA: hypothetical protein VJZ71_11675 [Phycisphaerae bacterium]|nr:hypothetical protein [Phycisphaerae bacterium]